MGNVCPEECLLLSYSYQLGGLTAFSVADVQDILFRGLVFELVLAGSDEADHLAGAFGRSNIAGGDGNDRIVGSYNSDWFSGGAGNDIISGGAGKDLLEGGAGNDKLNGGNGSDLAIFSGAMADYTISAKAYEATVSVNTDVDSLYQIEFLQFDDGFYNIAAQFGLKVDPIAQVDAVSVAENETVQFTVIDNDIDDGTFSFLSFTDVSHGVLSHFGNGQFEYTGDLNYFGDDVFTYDIVDLDGNIATASVYLTVEAVNSAPDASPDILYLDQ